MKYLVNSPNRLSGLVFIGGPSVCEIGLKGFALEFNFLSTWFDASETRQKAFMNLFQRTIKAYKVMNDLALHKKLANSYWGKLVLKTCKPPPH